MFNLSLNMKNEFVKLLQQRENPVRKTSRQRKSYNELLK
jgi:hypothetical protein